MRVGLVGLHLESAIRNPVATTAASFRIHRGAALFAALEVDETRARLGDEAPEFVPIWYGRARPGGRLQRADAGRLLQELRGALAGAGPLDGLVLAQHGGLRLADGGNGEAMVAQACREALGGTKPIVACYDPHGDPGDAALTWVDGACAFRTAPHVDIVPTRVRAVRLLQRVAAARRRPVTRLVRGPLVLPGTMAEGPGAGADAFGVAVRSAQRPGVLDASWFPASPWTDARPGRAGFLVVAEDEGTALQVAGEANREVEGWRHRFRFRDPLVDLAEAVRRVAVREPVRNATRPASSATRPTRLLLDAGDAIGAGAVGDRWEVAFALFDADVRDVLVAGVVAPDLAARCRAAGAGASFRTTAGPESSPGEGQVRRLELRVEDADVRLPRDPGDALPPAAGAAVLVASGGVRVLLLSARRELGRWRDLERAVGPSTRWRWIVVKATRRPPDLPVGTETWTLDSPGATCHRLGHGRID